MVHTRVSALEVKVRGAGTGLEPSLWDTVARGSLQWASSQGDVRSRGAVFPMAYPAVRPLPTQTPATSTARDADYRFDADYVFGQNMTEYNPAPSPSVRLPASERSSDLLNDKEKQLDLYTYARLVKSRGPSDVPPGVAPAAAFAEKKRTTKPKSAIAARANSRVAGQGPIHSVHARTAQSLALTACTL